MYNGEIEGIIPVATVTDKAIEAVEKFLRQLKNADINIERAV